MSRPVVLVTGGSRGIGAASSRRLVDDGWQVVIGYRERADAADALVASLGGHASALAGDVAREEDVLRMFATIDERYGRLDALVNNAGIVAPATRVADMGGERIRRIFATNVLGAFYCAREAVRRMSTSNGGRGGAIVNVSSVAAKHGASFEYVDYAASKGAVDTMTVGLAKEVATEGIRVNSVRPGLIETEIHASGGAPDRVERLAATVPMQRGGKAEEVANLIAWLLSDEASYVTGSIVDVAGGR